MIYSLAMSTIVTVAVLLIGWRAVEISSGTVTALAALWSVELTLSALIKVTEGKEIKADSKFKNDTEGSI